jgi:hypothetical protein
MYVCIVQYMHPLEIQRQMIERCLFKLYTIHSLYCLSVERDIDKDPNGDTKISPGATLRVSYPRPLVRADRPTMQSGPLINSCSGQQLLKSNRLLAAALNCRRRNGNRDRPLLKLKWLFDFGRCYTSQLNQLLYEKNRLLLQNQLFFSMAALSETAALPQQLLLTVS